MLFLPYSIYSHPTILKQSAAQLLRRPPPKPLGLPKDVHQAIIEGMDRVVSSTGTARAAMIKGVSVAGKTGTAQINKAEGNLELAWFVGFAPVDDPKIAIDLMGYSANKWGLCLFRVNFIS